MHEAGRLRVSGLRFRGLGRMGGWFRVRGLGWRVDSLSASLLSSLKNWILLGSLQVGDLLAQQVGRLLLGSKNRVFPGQSTGRILCWQVGRLENFA